ncbi:MAG TPA: carbohydrate ABC transporter permease [Phycisphaeraceae bacterium]
MTQVQTPTRAPARATAAAGAAPLLRRRRLAGRDPSPLQQLIVYALLCAGAVGMIVPFIWMVSNSLKTDAEARLVPPTLLPTQPLWSNYPEALQMMGFGRALANTVVITFCCVVGQVISSSLVGFGFARFRFRGREAMFLLMLSTMMLPGQVTMIPVFILFRSLGWIDTFWPLIVPAWVASPFFAFMFRQFFAQVPEELIEAARIDGASNWSIYWRMMLPLSSPVIAIVAIYTFMGTWNDFMGPLIYLNSPDHYTLALALNSFNGQYGVQHVNLLMAASVVTALPCIVLFFAAQKYFVESVAMTGMKG